LSGRRKKIKIRNITQRGEKTVRERSSVFETEIEAVQERYIESEMDKISKEEMNPEMAIAKQ